MPSPNTINLSNLGVDELQQLAEKAKKEIQAKHQGEVAKLREEINKAKAEANRQIEAFTKTAYKKAEEIQAKISELTGRSVSSVQKRTRMSGGEVRQRILGVIEEYREKGGITQIEIHRKGGVSYQTVVKFIKDHPNLIHTEGSGKAKRAFPR